MTEATARPQEARAGDYAFPKFERHVLENGLTIVVAPVHKLPFVTISAIVDAGAELDADGRAGLAQITAKLLTEGAGAYDGAALAERLELLGSSLSADADWDAAAVEISVMRERFEAAASALADVLLRPLLPEGELERLKAERLAELLQTRTEPRSLADEMFSALIYEGASRYSRPLGGYEKSVRAITADDVREFHRARYTPAATTIIVAGDVSVGDALSVFRRGFSSWAGGDKHKPDLTVGRARSATRMHLVSKESAPQSELRIGHIGPSRRTPDYFDIVVMNAILGGLFSSRINLNLREKHAYTYGAFSHFEWRRERGPFVVSTAVKSDATLASIREVLFEIERMRSEPVSDDELSLAVNYLSGVFPIRFETTQAIAGALAALAIHELPVDYYDSYRREIAAVSAQRVLRAARTHLVSDELEIVVVGDPGVVHAGLSKLSGGTVEFMDPAEILE